MFSIFSCYLTTILSSDVFDTEPNGRSTDTKQINGVPVESEADTSDQLEILPRNDVPVLADSIKLVAEHSVETNDERTSASSDSAVPSTIASTSTSATAVEVEPDVGESHANEPIDAASGESLSASTQADHAQTAPAEIPYVFLFT